MHCHRSPFLRTSLHAVLTARLQKEKERRRSCSCATGDALLLANIITSNSAEVTFRQFRILGTVAFRDLVISAQQLIAYGTAEGYLTSLIPSVPTKHLQARIQYKFNATFIKTWWWNQMHVSFKMLN